MEIKIVYLVPVLLVLFASGISAWKLPKTAWRQLRSYRHMKRTSEPVRRCEMAGDALDRLLASHDSWAPPGSFNFDPLFQLILGYPLEDFSGSRLFCQLEGVSTADELYLRLRSDDQERYMFKAFRMVYWYGIGSISGYKQYAMQTLEQDYISEDYRESLEDTLDLCNHLQASGFTQLDPNNTETLFALLEEAMGMEFPDPEPISTLPMAAQCAMITNDIRKIWSRFIKQSIQWMPDASNYYRELVYNVTAITIPPRGDPNAHQVMKDTICPIIEQSTLNDLFNTVETMRILPTLFKYGYRQLQEAENHGWLVPPSYHYYNSYGDNTDHPETDPDSVPALLNDFIQVVRDMGLFDLE